MRLAFQYLGTCGTIRPVRIVRLELTNIGPFVGASIDFPVPPEGKGELVLFEGPNGCGKTTILYSVACLLAGSKAAFFGAPVDPFSQRAEEGALVRMTVEHSGDPAPTRIECCPTKNGGTNPPPTSTGHTEGSRSFDLLREYQAGAKRAQWAAYVYRAHGPNASLRAKGIVPNLDDGEPIHRGALSPDARAHRGQQFGYLLMSLRHQYRDMVAYTVIRPDQAEHYQKRAAAKLRALDGIKSALARVLDRRVDFDFIGEDEEVIVTIDERAIDPNVLGEGMRSSLSWITDLLFRLQQTKWVDDTISPWEQEFWLLLDEIEESLHPTRQMQIIPALRSLFPSAHIYATTHSPFVVASAGEGTVIPIRPDKDHMVRGTIVPRELAHGQSLEWVVREIFQAQAGFVDQQTRDDLDAHDREIGRLRKKKPIDWSVFLARRDRLLSLNDEVRTVAAMQEVPVRAEILERLAAREDDT